MIDKLCCYIESGISFTFKKILHLNISEDRLKGWCQFIKFGIVGEINNLIYYVVYVLLVAFSVNYLLSSMVAFGVSVINAYYWNNKYVFEKGKDENRVWWITLMKSFLAYAGTGILLNSVLLVIWVRVFSIHKMIAPILSLFITVPMNFIINKLWAFRT